MSDLTMLCPSCHSRTTSVGMAARDGFPCPHCGRPLPRVDDAGASTLDYAEGYRAGREAAAADIDELAFALVSGGDDAGTALTAAVMQRAAQIARGGK